MAIERKGDETQALVKILNDAAPELARLAPKYVNVNRLMALALEARMRTPLLAKCSIDSIVAFCKRTAEWGTDRVGAGGVWPVPFWSTKNNCYEAVAIPDWRFIVEKAKKARAIKHATADVVREGDVFEVVRGLNPDLTHKPAPGGAGAVIAAYCVYTLPDGTRDFQVMWLGELEKVRDSSNAWKSYLKDKTKTCPYNYWPEEMHKKAVTKRTLKTFEGASIELSQILEADHVAMGFDRFGEQPEPIAMPRAIEAAPAETTTETEQPKTEEKTSNVQADDNPAIVTIANVTVRTGKTGEKAWARYSIVTDAGVIYSTFDETLAERAKEAKGYEVALSWERSGKYLNCTGFEPTEHGPMVVEPEGADLAQGWEPGMDAKPPTR